VVFRPLPQFACPARRHPLQRQPRASALTGPGCIRRVHPRFPMTNVWQSTSTGLTADVVRHLDPFGNAFAIRPFRGAVARPRTVPWITGRRAESAWMVAPARRWPATPARAKCRRHRIMNDYLPRPPMQDVRSARQMGATVAKLNVKSGRTLARPFQEAASG